MKALFLYIRK